MVWAILARFGRIDLLVNNTDVAVSQKQHATAD
jgi:hypothetical protein